VAEPDDPRQQVGDAHVGTAQPDLRKDEAELRAGRRDPEVRRARDHATGADRDAVDRRHDRPLALPHRADQPTGRAGERQQRRGIAPEQVLDDVVLIAARAEARAASGDHDRADVVVVAEVLERLRQLLVDLEGQRVAARRPIQREGGDPAVELRTK
jgi:hypothetical protein